MSNGKPKKFRKFKRVARKLARKREDENASQDVTKVYKDKRHEIKRELSFTTKDNKSRLA